MVNYGIVGPKEFVKFPVSYMTEHGFKPTIVKCDEDELTYEFYKMYRYDPVTMRVKAQPKEIIDKVTLKEGLAAEFFGLESRINQAIEELKLEIFKRD